MNLLHSTWSIFILFKLTLASSEQSTENIEILKGITEEIEEGSRETTEDNEISKGDNGSQDGNELPEVDENEGTDLLSKLNRVVQRSTYGWSMGIVPYYVDPESYDTIIAKRIRNVMNEIESSSCVVFRELPKLPEVIDQSSWLHITNPDQERDCVHQSNVGTDGEAVMVLGYDCMQRQDILHALLHALGFKDEVSHPQRDQYIRIMWENIQPKYRPLFRINMEETPYKTVVEYDTMSVMHFHDRAYSINGGATIAPVIPGLLINPSDKLSLLDVMKLRLAFGHECNKRKVGKLLDTCKMAMRDKSPPDDEDDKKGPSTTAEEMENLKGFKQYDETVKLKNLAEEYDRSTVEEDRRKA